MSFTFENTYDDIFASIEDAKRIVGSMRDEDDSIYSPIYNAVLKSIDDHSKLLGKWETDFHKIQTSDSRDAIRILKNESTLRLLSSLPSHYSRLLNLLQIWTSQRELGWIRKEVQFATRLAESYIKSLGMSVKPLVLFTHDLSVIDFKSYAILTIPIVYRQKFDRWPSMVHEIGHLYLKHNAAWDQKSLSKMIATRLNKLDPNLSDSKVQEQIVAFSRLFEISWIPEFFADYVALVLSGPNFIPELYKMQSLSAIDSISTSHPPWSLRIEIALEVAQVFGIDKQKAHELFYLGRLPEPDFGEIEQVFAGKDIAADLVSWLSSQSITSRLESFWRDITADNQTIDKKSTPIHLIYDRMLFEALSSGNLQEIIDFMNQSTG